MSVGIYKITSPSGKVYIGQSWNIEKRWRSHIKTHNINLPLYNSFAKHGYNQHTFEIIHSLPNDVTQEVLDTYEIVYMSQYKELGFKMLNIREGGSKGKHSEDTKKKLANINKGRKHSGETKQKYSQARKGSGNAMFGKKHSEETKIKFSKIHKGKKNSKEATQKQIDKISKAIYQIDPTTMNIIQEWKSATEAGRSLNLNGTVISHGIKKQYKTYGYYWKFKN